MKNNQEHDLKQESLGHRILIYFLCVVISTALTLFMVISKLIIIILWPLVKLSLFLQYLNLIIENTILKEKLKYLKEVESDSELEK